MNSVDFINLTLSSITALAVVFAAIQLKINRKQLFLHTISKCITDFRSLGELNKETNDIRTINKYIDLTNEELFYIQHMYIPRDVAIEWIDGMIDFIPISNRNGVVLNLNFAIRYISENRELVFQNFPRVQNAFEINTSYDFDLIFSGDSSTREDRISERKKLIDDIMRNIKNYDCI